jgi:lactate 2-monooxygenase
MEEVAAAMGAAPRWFQLYWSRSDELVRSFVERAEACGCTAIVLTLDTTMLGWRPRDLDLGSLPFLKGKGIAQYTSDPVFRRQLSEPIDGPVGPKPVLNFSTVATALAQKARFPGGFLNNLTARAPRAAVQRFLATYSRPSLEWDDLETLRVMTSLPIVLKGILHADDAKRALASGMNGLIVSNHGGRQIDGGIATLDALPAIVDAVNGAIPVLLDSGVRGGADVFKALALGASAVCLGRPYVYGLAVAGERGVSEVIANVLAEFDLTMGLAGCTRAAEISRDSVISL